MDAGFVAERLPELLLRTREHLFLTGISTGMAVICAIPLGIFITRKGWPRSFVFGLAGVIQTVPSLAMLAFLLAALVGAIVIMRRARSSIRIGSPISRTQRSPGPWMEP